LNGLPLPVSQDDHLFFKACTKVQIGNGEKALFCKDAWLQDFILQDRFPDLFKLARRKNLTVKIAMEDGRWMKELQRINSIRTIDFFVELWEEMQNVKFLMLFPRQCLMLLCLFCILCILS
jgi:hypothetical protein